MSSNSCKVNVNNKKECFLSRFINNGFKTNIKIGPPCLRNKNCSDDTPYEDQLVPYTGKNDPNLKEAFIRGIKTKCYNYKNSEGICCEKYQSWSPIILPGRSFLSIGGDANVSYLSALINNSGETLKVVGSIDVKPLPSPINKIKIIGNIPICRYYSFTVYNINGEILNYIESINIKTNNNKYVIDIIFDNIDKRDGNTIYVNKNKNNSIVIILRLYGSKQSTYNNLKIGCENYPKMIYYNSKNEEINTILQTKIRLNGLPLNGLQTEFIYKQFLNYLLCKARKETPEEVLNGWLNPSYLPNGYPPKYQDGQPHFTIDVTGKNAGILFQAPQSEYAVANIPAKNVFVYGWFPIVPNTIVDNGTINKMMEYFSFTVDLSIPKSVIDSCSQLQGFINGVVGPVLNGLDDFQLRREKYKDVDYFAFIINPTFETNLQILKINVPCSLLLLMYRQISSDERYISSLSRAKKRAIELKIDGTTIIDQELKPFSPQIRVLKTQSEDEALNLIDEHYTSFIPDADNFFKPS